MDINELIDNLRFPSWHDLEDPDATLLADAADALSTLQAENERLRKELEYEREHANAYHEECGQWEAENEKLRAELERVKRERDAAQRLLAEHTGVVGMEKVTTCAEKKAWLRRYQGSLRQEKELAEEVEQLEVEI